MERLHSALEAALVPRLISTNVPDRAVRDRAVRDGGVDAGELQKQLQQITAMLRERSARKSSWTTYTNKPQRVESTVAHLRHNDDAAKEALYMQSAETVLGRLGTPSRTSSAGWIWNASNNEVLLITFEETGRVRDVRVMKADSSALQALGF